MNLQQSASALLQWVVPQLQAASSAMGDANVACYYSGFLSKPPQNADLGICEADLLGFHDAYAGMPTDKPLILILHTLGGDADAVDMIVEYTHNRFNQVIAVVPHTAMSGGTAIALSCDEIYLSQTGMLGPIDPQMRLRSGPATYRYVAANHVVRLLGRTPLSDPEEYNLFHRARRTSENSIRHTESALARKNKPLYEIHRILNRFHISAAMHSQPIYLKDIQDIALKVNELEKMPALNISAQSAIGYLESITRNTNITRVIISHKRALRVFP